MLSQTLRASSQGVARIARQHAVSSRRTFVTTAVRQADLVQEMYLRELKNYKVPQVKSSDAEGHVQKFTAPTTPRSPEEGDLANDLKAYETQQVEVEGQGGEGGASSAAADNWFEEEDYSEDDSKAHH